MKQIARYAVGLMAVVALAAVSAVPSWTQNAPKAAVAKTAPTVAKVVTPVAQKPAAANSASKGIHTGITVHGWWVIDVRNPDGKLVTHREFENTLVSNDGANVGDTFLAGVLGRTATVGQWIVGLTTDSSQALYVAEPGYSIPNCGVTSAGCANTLSPDLVGQFSNSLALTGKITVPAAIIGTVKIIQVGTGNNGGANAFTSAPVSPGVSIGTGQLINVSVTFSFQ